MSIQNYWVIMRATESSFARTEGDSYVYGPMSLPEALTEYKNRVDDLWGDCNSPFIIRIVKNVCPQSGE